jgi:2-dehydro-3-deoxyphosphogluconate aldolase/(4S)-4-hydroxy-2-oxoglutarate aldolase
MDVNGFNELPLLGILRGIGPDIVEPITDTILSSGLRTVEITMNTRGAASLIRKMAAAASGRLTIGAGTVLSMDDLRLALEAGASFIVMPAMVPDVVGYCVKNSIPVFPGALTPQEILNAWTAGATMVKVFPASFFGPGYLKEIKGPFNDIKLLACGGVSSDNLGEFFSCGASAVAFGGSVFSSHRLERGDFSSIEKEIKDLITSFYQCSGKSS